MIKNYYLHDKYYLYLKFPTYQLHFYLNNHQICLKKTKDMYIFKGYNSPHTTQIFGIKYTFIVFFEINQMLNYALTLCLVFFKLNCVQVSNINYIDKAKLLACKKNNKLYSSLVTPYSFHRDQFYFVNLMDFHQYV